MDLSVPDFDLKKSSPIETYSHSETNGNDSMINCSQRVSMLQMLVPLVESSPASDV